MEKRRGNGRRVGPASVARIEQRAQREALEAEPAGQRQARQERGPCRANIGIGGAQVMFGLRDIEAAQQQVRGRPAAGRCGSAVASADRRGQSAAAARDHRTRALVACISARWPWARSACACCPLGLRQLGATGLSGPMQAEGDIARGLPVGKRRLCQPELLLRPALGKIGIRHRADHRQPHRPLAFAGSQIAFVRCGILRAASRTGRSRTMSAPPAR
jgi:hypothetical protein